MWAIDHLFWPNPLDECLTTLAVAAAATEQLTLGSCILQLPLRHPAAVAKQVTTLQNLSGGRFVLGLGVGIHPGEYELAEVDYHRRGRLMDEGIAAMERAWGGADDLTAKYRQAPSSSRVPIWIGGSSLPAVKRTAAVADGWIPLFVTADEYGPALGALRHEIVEAGRQPEAVEVGVVVFVHVDDHDEAPRRGAEWLSSLYGLPAKAFGRHLVAGPAEACAAELVRYVEAGARHIVVVVAGSGAVRHFSELRTSFLALTEAVSVSVAP